VNLFSHIQQNPHASDWAKWVAASSCPSACTTRELLQISFSRIPSTRKNRFLDRIGTEDAAGMEADLHQLVAHELLWRFELHPEWEPAIRNFKPDLAFNAHGVKFIADVFVSHSPQRTIDRNEHMSRDTSEPAESRAKKIADRIVEKAEKYKALSQPLVLFGFLGDHHILSTAHFENALFGRTADELEPGEYFPEAGKAPIVLGGVLLPLDDGRMPHENLSAVVVLDWFDSLDRSDPGKRLHCLVLHHWAPVHSLPVDAFKPFCQLTWKKEGTLRWTPQYTGERNIAARFCGTEGLRLAPYSPNAPW
jgi:hypothetical protein